MNARARAQLNGNKTFRFRLQFSSFVHFLWSQMRMRANTQFCMHFVSTDFRFDSLAFLAAGTSTLAIFSFVFHRFSLPSRKIPIRFVWPLFRHRRRLVRKLIHSLFLHFILFRRQFLVLHIFFPLFALQIICSRRWHRCEHETKQRQQQQNFRSHFVIYFVDSRTQNNEKVNAPNEQSTNRLTEVYCCVRFGRVICTQIDICWWCRHHHGSIIKTSKTCLNRPKRPSLSLFQSDWHSIRSTQKR